MANLLNTNEGWLKRKNCLTALPLTGLCGKSSYKKACSTNSLAMLSEPLATSNSMQIPCLWLQLQSHFRKTSTLSRVYLNRVVMTDRGEATEAATGRLGVAASRSIDLTISRRWRNCSSTCLMNSSGTRELKKRASIERVRMAEISMQRCDSTRNSCLSRSSSRLEKLNNSGDQDFLSFHLAAKNDNRTSCDTEKGESQLLTRIWKRAP